MSPTNANKYRNKSMGKLMDPPIFGLFVAHGVNRSRYFARHEQSGRRCCDGGHPNRYTAVEHGQGLWLDHD